MDPYTLVLSPEAKVEIKNIKYYLKYILLSSKAGQDFETTLFEKLTLIETEPHLYPILQIGERAYRFALVKKYLVVFKISDDARRVEVITVTHNSCNFQERLKQRD